LRSASSIGMDGSAERLNLVRHIMADAASFCYSACRGGLQISAKDACE
jgi:hypothetical protein